MGKGQNIRIELDNALVNEGFESPELINAIIDTLKKNDPDLEEAASNLDLLAHAINWAAIHV